VSGVSDAVAIGAGGDASCAVLSIGSVDCWGGEYTGELGNGKIANGSDPTATGVLGISDAVAVGAGSGYACALLKSGAVQCWGDNSTGELATGSTHSADATPVAIQGIP
jgi:alpha-tubulin suppressor-like RCC1 family protein